MSFLGFGRNRGAQPNRLGSIQIQTSERGVPIPYAAGNVKLAMKMLDYVGFTSIPQTSGGKGGGGSVTGYDYTASIDGALCAGPIDGIGNVYDEGGDSSLEGTVESFTVPSGGGTYQTDSDTVENDEGCTYAKPYSYTVDDYGSDGPQTISGIEQAPMQKVTGTPGAGQYSVAFSSGFLEYTFSAADAGKLITITYSYATATTNFVSPASKYNFSTALGIAIGTVWGYMAANFASRALSYPGIARILAMNFDLGEGATPPNLSVEVLNARGLSFGSGVSDCDPAAIVADICNGFIAGFNWPYLGDLTQFSNFCVANNLFQSVAYDAQRKGLDVLKEIITLSNAEAVWSQGALKIVPYGDTSAQANGRAYVPQTTPVYAIDDSDTISGTGEEPIIVAWKGLADNYNSLQFQYTRRDDNYNTDVLNDKDEASILMNGLLPAQTITGDNYRDKNYAAVAMNMLLKRNSVALREYKFTLKWFYFLLEPMDIILLNRYDGGRPVRIVSVEENDDYSLSIVAEDFFFGVGNGVLYPKGDGGGNGPGSHDQPGDTTLLAAFQPSTRLTNGLNQLWLALKGGSKWGGCDVWISKDNATYKKIPNGRQFGASRAGVLTAAFANGSDPDTANTASVSCSGDLESGSMADADAFATLCLVGDELISYETATLTGTGTPSTVNLYDLGTYLRRGIFSNNARAHSAGEIFVRLDDSVMKYTIDPTLRGVVYLKLTSFNLYGNEEQELANVTAIPVTITEPIVAANMAVGSFLDVGGLTATVDAYKQGGMPGDSGSATLNNGALVIIPPYSMSGLLCSQWYGLNYNPATSAYVLYTDESAWLADQLTMIPISFTTTPAAGSTVSLPDNYTDSGSVPTDNPSGPYSGGTAVVSSSATWSKE